MADLWLDVDTNLAEVPVNLLPLLDATDFKSIEADVNYNATGLALIWHFVTAAGAYSQTAVTPTDTGGNYDWVEQGNGLFTIEIPATGGATINNDTEGFGWFTGVATGVLPWRGPVIGFRRAALNDLLIDGSTASTNLEDFLDGTGYAGGTIKLSVSTGAMEAGALADFINVDSGVTSAATVEGSVAKELADLLAVPSAATVADAVWDEASTGHTDAGKAGAQLWTDIDAILVDTGTDGVLVAGMKQAALADFFDTDSGTTFAAAVAGSVVKETAGSATVTGDVTVSAASRAAIVDDVWNEAATGHTDAGKAGAQLWTDIDAILADTGTDGVVVASIANNAITAAAIADNAIDAAALAADVATEIGAGITIPTAASIADAVWDEAATGHIDAGKAGAQLWTDVDAILADTGTDGVIVASIANGAITAAAIATDAIDADALASDAVLEIATAATGLSAYGTGSESVTLGVAIGGVPIDGVAVWITSDVAGATVVAGTVYTPASGHITVFLDPGTYYVWKQHAGYNFTNPETITVTDV